MSRPISTKTERKLADWDEILDLTGAARFLKCSPRTIEHWISDRRFGAADGLRHVGDPFIEPAARHVWFRRGPFNFRRRLPLLDGSQGGLREANHYIDLVGLFFFRDSPTSRGLQGDTCSFRSF